MGNKDFLEASLTEIGLTRDQALVYKTLLDSGSSKAFKIAFNSGVKRALVYKVLDQLKGLGLVASKERPESKVTTFYPLHPTGLEKLVSNKKETVKAAENSLNEVIQTLTSSYNLINKKPNVQFFEGDKGIQYVFDDILRLKSDVLLFRSYLDTANERISLMIDEHRVRRKRLGLNVRLISSRKPTDVLILQDKENNMVRRYMPEEKFALPAQITVYGNKVAITSYKDPIITTVIENPEIKTTFTVLFELLWSQAAPPLSSLAD